MKKSYALLLAVLTVATVSIFSSCRFNCKKGSGNQVTETRGLQAFTKVDISGGYKVVIRQDSSQRIAISADDNLMKYIKTEIDGSTLRVYSKKNMCPSGELTLVIGVKSLKGIEASGAVEVRSDGLIRAEDLTFDLSGATKIDMELNAARVHTTGSGSTQISLKGQAASHDVDLSGSGKIDALDFVVGKYEIETSGSSHCNINVLNDLSVHTSGAAEIKYRGNPANVSNDKSGASSVEKID